MMRVAEIGSGTGRIVMMLLEAGARHVTAIEPSESFQVLEQAVRAWPDRVTAIRALGSDNLHLRDLDIVFSIGVLHHIPEPVPVVSCAFSMLRPGGRAFAWLYGREGADLYLMFARPLRGITKHLPHWALNGLAGFLEVMVRPYAALCRSVQLPMREYMNRVWRRLDRPTRKLAIYDQLNPDYARYYRKDEAVALFEQAGFIDIRIHSRHGYSWSILGTKPAIATNPAEDPMHF